MNDTTSNTTGNGDKNFEEEIGALWKRKSKNGLTYLAGHVKIEDELGTEKMVKVVLFSNKKKTNGEASSAAPEAPQESSEAEDLL